jgi:hypothetical protein
MPTCTMTHLDIQSQRVARKINVWFLIRNLYYTTKQQDTDWPGQQPYGKYSHDFIKSYAYHSAMNELSSAGKVCETIDAWTNFGKFMK